MNIKSWRCVYREHLIAVDVTLVRARLSIDGRLLDEAPGLLSRLFSPAIDLRGTIRSAEGTTTLFQAFIRRPGRRLAVLQCQVWVDSIFYLTPDVVDDMEIVSFLFEGIVRAGLGALGGALVGAILGLGSGAAGVRLAAGLGALIGVMAGASIGSGACTVFPPHLPEDVRLLRYVTGQHSEGEDEDSCPHPD